jgi:hypothetical protein
VDTGSFLDKVSKFVFSFAPIEKDRSAEICFQCRPGDIALDCALVSHGLQPFQTFCGDQPFGTKLLLSSDDRRPSYLNSMVVFLSAVIFLFYVFGKNMCATINCPWNGNIIAHSYDNFNLKLLIAYVSFFSSFSKMRNNTTFSTRVRLEVIFFLRNFFHYMIHLF